MTYVIRKTLVPVFALLFCASCLRAAEENVVDQRKIEKWIEQLDAGSLTKRQKARTELANAGQTAIPALAKAALSDKRDLIAHSIDVLAEIAKGSTDAETKKAATVALKMLSESDKPSTAERAKLALRAEKDGGIEAFPGWNKPGGEFAGNSFVHRNVSVSSINGMKTITVKEAGKTTTIQDQPSGAIGVRITGEGETKQFAATSLKELKKKNPAAFDLYQQYGGNAGRPNIANFGGFGGFGLPGGFGNRIKIIANGAQANGPAEMNHAAAVTANQMMIQHLNELKERMAGNPEMQQILSQQIKALQQ